jgi:hypothetical protein
VFEVCKKCAWWLESRGGLGCDPIILLISPIAGIFSPNYVTSWRSWCLNHKLHGQILCLRWDGWYQYHRQWVKIPSRDGDNHIRQGEGSCSLIGRNYSCWVEKKVFGLWPEGPFVILVFSKS